MRLKILAALAAGVTCALGVASAEPQRYENHELHYALTVPDGWVRMPDDVLKTRGRGNGETSRIPAPVAG